MFSRERYTHPTISARLRPRTVLLGLVILAGTQQSLMAQPTPTATYGYDPSGNTTTIVYTDQTCVVHTYDSSGNRTATDITKADVPETPIWGDGVWGCNAWSP